MDTFTRCVPFKLSRSVAEGDGLTLTGYAAVFNSVTRINGEMPRVFDEQIARGAFTKTIQEGTPILQFDHGSHPMVGSIPIGQITEIAEDARGLYVEARLHDNWLTQPVRDAIASQSIRGMSFRFSVPEGKEIWDEREDDVPLRTITEVRCMELGPVVFPAYEDTLVGVRSLIDSWRVLSAEEDASIVDQIKSLVITLLSDEVEELQADPDATGAISALLTVLSDLDWYEYVDAAEDAAAMDETADMAIMSNSQSELGTSRRAALALCFSKPPAAPAEPPPDSTQFLSVAAAELALLELHRS